MGRNLGTQVVKFKTNGSHILSAAVIHMKLVLNFLKAKFLPLLLRAGHGICALL